jgi:SAM-dependent methyltransferase
MTIPWYFKMSGKIVLSRIPLSHALWNRIGVFKYGPMQDYEYAYGVFTNHLKMAGLEEVQNNATRTALELGPGESLYSAVLAKAFGFRGSLLVDVGDFSLPDPGAYQQFAVWLRARGFQSPDLSDCSDLSGILARLNAKYLTDGLDALRLIPDRSVDFIFSQAVLEHVRRNEFLETARQLRRILAPQGVSSHVIDLKDHLQASLNNLRFSESFWESDFISSSGFYTNRLRYEELIDVFKQVGFAVEVISKSGWDTLPIPRRVLHRQFRSLPDESLCISEVVLRLR